MKRVEIENDFLRNGIKLHFFERDGHGSTLVGWPTGFAVATRIDPGTESDYPEGYGPLRIDESYTRALFEALGQHLGLHPETASLRADYEHERKRVDKFIEHLTEQQFQLEMRRSAR